MNLLTLLYIVIGVILLLFIVFVITIIERRLHPTTVDNFKDIFIGKLENTDASISDAIQHLKLINSIKDEYEEKENDRKSS